MERRRWLGLVVLPLLAGCVAAPPRTSRDPGLTIPERFAAASDVAPPPVPEDGFWTGFGDPELDRLVGEALSRNRDLQAAAARLSRAEAQARIAGAGLKPAVGTSLSAARRRQNFVGFPLPGGGVLTSTSSSFGVSVETSWEADLWGRLRAGARAALADRQAVEADLRGARLSVAGQTAKAWFSAIDARQQLDLARRSAASFKSVADQVRARYEEGLRPALDLRLALSNQAGAEALVAARTMQLDRAVRQLEVLLGSYPSGELRGRLDALELPPPPVQVPAGLPAELLTRRPDLVSAERRLAALDQRVREARRALYPRLTLTASGGTVSDMVSDLVDGDFRVWSILGGLVQPLFQGGRLRAAVDVAEASADEALAAWAGQTLRAFAEVESALVAESALAEQERAADETARQLTAARDLAEERYRSGLGSYLVVLESQTRALTAESSLLDTRLARLVNRIDLYLALGGDFAEPAPSPARSAS